LKPTGAPLNFDTEAGLVRNPNPGGGRLQPPWEMLLAKNFSLTNYATILFHLLLLLGNFSIIPCIRPCQNASRAGKEQYWFFEAGHE